MSNFSILHNPRCSKSRQTLALLEENGVQPTILEYLKEAPSIEILTTLVRLLDCSPRDILRKGEAEYTEAGLADTTLSDEQIISLMHQFPKVIERPIVFTADKAVVGRPPENVLGLIK